MFLLRLILVLLLHFEGVSGVEPVYLYHSSGQNVTLPCARFSHFGPTCSDINWLYDRDSTQTFHEVKNGKVSRNSHRAGRLSVDESCSLIISNITGEDFGHYTCRFRDDVSSDQNVYVGVLTISTSPPDADPVRDGEVTLECSLHRDRDLGPCSEKTVLWQDERGRVLLDKGDGYEFITRLNCVSVLKVKRQSDNNRKYTCTVMDEKNSRLISADYTPIFTDSTNPTNPTDPTTYFIIGGAVGAVALLIVITAIFFKCRKTAKETKNAKESSPSPNVVCAQEEPEEALTYITYTDNNKKASPRIQMAEEEVTYSTVKTSS